MTARRDTAARWARRALAATRAEAAGRPAETRAEAAEWAQRRAAELPRPVLAELGREWVARCAEAAERRHPDVTAALLAALASGDREEIRARLREVVALGGAILGAEGAP